MSCLQMEVKKVERRIISFFVHILRLFLYWWGKELFTVKRSEVKSELEKCVRENGSRNEVDNLFCT